VNTSQHARKRVTLNGPLLAQFLQQVEQEETFSLQHQREYEEQALRLARLGPHPQLPRSDEIPPEITIDLTNLRCLMVIKGQVHLKRDAS
jgi:hypothetical protein